MGLRAVVLGSTHSEGGRRERCMGRDGRMEEQGKEWERSAPSALR